MYETVDFWPSQRRGRHALPPARLTVCLQPGSGYVADDAWGHGAYRGPLQVQGLVHVTSTPSKRRDFADLCDTLCRFELETGQVGYGMHENMCLGTHHPRGFHTPDATAP